jgi:hypothetical protein
MMGFTAEFFFYNSDMANQYVLLHFYSGLDPCGLPQFW